MDTIQLFRDQIQERIKFLKEMVEDARARRSKDLVLLQNKLSIQEIFLQQTNDFIEWLVDDDLDKTLNNS